MKKTLYAAALMTGVILSGCQTPAQKVDTAQEKVDSAKADLNTAKAELNAEYPAFKRDADEQISDNDKKITELRAKLKKFGPSPPYNIRQKKIDTLEKENSDLRGRLYGYETQRTDWVAFKVRFNHDKDDLNQAFVDFGKDLTK
jgi:peptidoglycan hydrolase CwlO-like protein